MVELERSLDLSADPVRRLGAVAVSVFEDADRLRGRLRLSNAEHDRLVCMAQHWRHVGPEEGEQSARSLLYRLGHEAYVDVVLLAWTRSMAGVEDLSWHALATLPARWKPPTFPLKSADFINRGVTKGPKLGSVLAAAEKAWVGTGFPLDPVALNAIADAAVRDVG
jgi:poly(A) polymerase